MASQYDSIKTAAELVQEVMTHGLHLDQEDLNRAADILGHSTIEELDFLANDIGRNNADGEPDPNGTFSSSRRGTRDTFYYLIFRLWHWEDAVRFWNQHTNPEHQELGQVCDENHEKMIENLNLSDKLRDEVAEHQQTKKELAATKQQLAEHIRHSFELTGEIQRLKAELYDYITKFGYIMKEERTDG